MAAIEVRGLRKVYDGRPAVDGLDLEIDDGECFALLGPNGAGKTTTVEIMEGFRQRDAGSVSVLGRDPARADRAWRSWVGVVSQSVGAALALTVRETIAHFAAYHARPRDTDELLAVVDLVGQARTRVGALSGGQRRRLDLALGIQGSPALLFLDEPTTGMDPRGRREFWELIRSLQRDGTTVLLTTHYLEEAEQLADRVGVLARGRLLDVAPPDRLGASLRLGATVRWREGDSTRELLTGTPTATLRDLLAAHPTGELAELSVHRPDLEDVYLALLDAADAADAAEPDSVEVL